MGYVAWLCDVKKTLDTVVVRRSGGQTRKGSAPLLDYRGKNQRIGGFTGTTGSGAKIVVTSMDAPPAKIASTIFGYIRL